MQSYKYIYFIVTAIKHKEEKGKYEYVLFCSLFNDNKVQKNGEIIEV